MRVTLIAHGPTVGTRPGVFGDDADLIERSPIALQHAKALLTAPEPACRQSAALVNSGGAAMSAEVLDDLRAPGMGAWTGLSAEQVLARDPAGLRAWLDDPAFSPPGGESLAGHLARIGGLLDSHDWPEAGAVVVATPLTVRAACTHALDAGARTLAHLDVGPGTRARISRHAGTWRLSAVVPPRFCSPHAASGDR